MKKGISVFSLLLLLGTAVLMAGSAYGGEKRIEGIWEGNLEVQGTTLKIVVKISKETDGTLKATLDSPDQGAMDVPLDNVAFEDNTFHFELTAAQGTYEGKLDESGDVIEGEWSQGGTSLPLVLKRGEK
ncbi:MAG: hypothetical protein JXB23_09655 [Candidatus Aminicenantes bacterium]|nr:hypothetical protein [Candidatus Aminicenantes bacterium]